MSVVAQSRLKYTPWHGTVIFADEASSDHLDSCPGHDLQ